MPSTTHCHVPVTVEIVGHLDDEALASLAGHVEQALADRIEAADRELARREAGASRVLAAPAGPVAETWVTERSQPLAGTYSVPSYDAGGAPVNLPVRQARRTVSSAGADSPHRQAVRRIHDLLHPGLFSRVSKEDARQAVAELQNLYFGRLELEFLMAVRLLRFSGDWQRLYQHLSPSDRLGYDYLARVADPALGILVPGDRLRLRFPGEQQMDGDYVADERGFIQLPYHVSVLVAGRWPADAANEIVKAYFEASIYWKLTVSLAPVSRGVLQGGGAVGSPAEVTSTYSPPPDARRKKFAEFVDYIRPVRPSDPFVSTALGYYLKEVDTSLEHWKTPAELWDWALRQVGQAPQSPLRAYLDLQRRLQAEAVAASPAERDRVRRALSDYVAWVADHSSDPRLGSNAPGYHPAEVYAGFYVKVFKADMAKARVAAAAKLEEERYEKRIAQFGSALDAALTFLQRRVLHAAEPRIAEDRHRMIGYLYYPSPAELIIRQDIASGYLDDLVARAGVTDLPAPDKIPADFGRWIGQHPELSKALWLTSAYPTVEKYKIDVPAWQIATEVIVGFIPIVGQIVGGYEAIYGEDLFGRELSGTERAIIGVTILLPSLGKLYKAGRGLLAADEMVRLYGLSAKEAEYTYRLALGLGPGTHAAGLFRSAGAEIRVGRKITDPKVLAALEQTLKDVGLTDREAVKVLAQHTGSPLKRVTPELEQEVRSTFGSAAEIEEEFRAAQAQVSESDLNREVLDSFGFGERGRIVSGAPPERFELGNFAHDNAELLIPESELPRGLDREFRIDLGEGVERRVDRLDKANGIVYEIKPDTPKWRAAGQKQAEIYAHWLDRYHPLPGGRRWQAQVVTYDAARLRKAFRDVGDLRQWIMGGGKK